ncbi:hypothetical protein V6N13_101554 [Hibiscus sabdariffa]
MEQPATSNQDRALPFPAIGRLSSLNSEQYTNISSRARDSADALEKLQFEFLSDSDNVDLLNRVKTTTMDLKEALRDEESFTDRS